MKLYFSLLFILCFIAKNIAQEKEFIVTNDNDTIYGKVVRGTNFLNPSKVVFRIKDEQGHKTRIDPKEVKTIRSIKGVDGNCIIKTIYDVWFAKRIIDGRIEVFQLIDGVMFFTSKGGGNIKRADFGGFGSRKKAHSQIRLLINDNAEILKEFDVMKGSAKNILNIIQKYNNSYK